MELPSREQMAEDGAIPGAWAPLRRRKPGDKRTFLAQRDLGFGQFPEQRRPAVAVDRRTEPAQPVGLGDRLPRHGLNRPAERRAPVVETRKQRRSRANAEQLNITPAEQKGLQRPALAKVVLRRPSSFCPLRLAAPRPLEELVARRHFAIAP